MSAPADYAEEAAFYFEAMQKASRTPIETMLELGAGGGNNASHMKHRVKTLVLSDLSDGMLAHSRMLNPDCQHHVGDMRTVRLHREFDAVFVHDTWLRLLRQAGFEPRVVTFDHSELEPGTYELFVCVKPG